MAERYRLLEASVDANTSPEGVRDAIAIARWLGEAFGEMSLLRTNLEAQHESQRANRELARAISRGDVRPGGTDYMEPDSDEGYQETLEESPDAR